MRHLPHLTLLLLATTLTPALTAPVSLSTLADQGYLRQGPPTEPSVIIHREGSEHPALATGRAVGPGATTCRYADFRDLPGASARADLRPDPLTGDLVASVRCRAPQASVAGIEWRLGPIPAAMDIIIPGFGGIKLTARSATTTVLMQYPMFWEAQLVIIEGPGRGFYVWSDDATSRYKRLAVKLTAEGWWLGFTTWNTAPFAGHTICQSVNWRLNTYRGDWRVPARRYVAWARRNLPPVADTRPAWLQDTRCVVILYNGPDLATLDMLAARLDPRQTLLYVPDWRPDGYDRLYPNYDAVPAFGPFVERAHALGFRVMPHLNHFACDPDHPLYPQFRAHHVRDPFGTHDLLWFIWDDAGNPANNRRLAYINPALSSWRALMLERIRALRDTYHVDGVYLDQTLNIYNDYNGLCEGRTMLEGNLALGREIRTAFPDLAVGGEGLNEVTARYQALCQRHAWGIDFERGAWNKPQLKLAHPISSYLFRPTLTFNYLGVPPPARAQFYAAWRENLVRWGVLPTLNTFSSDPPPQTGFSRQLSDEIRFWQAERVNPDMDGPWPAEVAFPWRTAEGRPVQRLTDGSLRLGDRVISRTVTDVTEARLPGTIEGAFCYDRRRILGLSPDQWYPWFPEPRDLSAFHVEALPAGATLGSATFLDGLAFLNIAEKLAASLPQMMDQALTGTTLFSGGQTQTRGPLNGEDGSQFAGAGDQIHAHPPWKAGTGTAWARWSIRLPRAGALRFTSGVAMASAVVGRPDALDAGAFGRSDGVLFGVTARAGAQVRHAELFNATDEGQPLELDLSDLAGQLIALELTVDPGPRRDVTADWARWYAPRIIEGDGAPGRLVLVDPARQALALSGTHVSTPHYTGSRGVAQVTVPGPIVLLREPPPAVAVPLDLGATGFLTAFTDTAGQVLTAPAWADASLGTGTVAAVTRSGLRVQPPQQGRTLVVYALRLPATPARFRAFTGLQDGAPSTGVDFSLQANGRELTRHRMLPGEPWREVTADLSPWAGLPVVLTLVTDSAGPFDGDWARWGDPSLLPAEPPTP